MQVYSTDRIRNVALLSHSGAGKTSLAEAFLLASGATTRLGSVTEGNTASDYEPEEVERRSSIQTSIIPCEWKGKKLNLLDAPGYADFLGEVISALMAADMAVIVVSAVDGLAVGTDIAWQRSGSLGLPRMMLINKLDRENASFLDTLEMIRKHFGRQCVAINVPQGSPPKGVASLLGANAGDDPGAAELREKLMEAVAEADDALTEKYLSEGTLSEADLVRGLRGAMLKGAVVPVMATSATQQVGTREIMDFLADYGPSPAERPPVKARDAAGKEIEIRPADGSPLAVRVFKTTADPYVGKLSYLRVMGAPLQGDSQVWNANKGELERVAHLFVPRGKAQEPVAMLASGDIGAVAKLQHTATGDTLCQRDKPIMFPPIEFPNPVVSVAITPKTKTDMDKMGASLVRLVEEDPSLRVSRDQESAETVLSSLGDAHVDVACKKLKRKFGVDVIVGTPAIPYRETIKGRTVSEYKHKKQSGGHGQYGHVVVELEPLPRGSGIEFQSKVVGGSVPKEYIGAVEKGALEATQQGVLAGSKVVDVKISVTDGSSHAVDSSNMAFQIASVQAVKKGLLQARPVLLEPVMRVKVIVPDAFTGDVMGDLNSKRARVSGTTPMDGMAEIEATVPLAEMQRYATELRSMTHGRGTYSMEFDHYEEVPSHLAQKIIDDHAKKQESK